MKKTLIFLPLCALLAAVWVLAAGDAGDPLVSLSHLTGAFADKVDTAVDRRLDESDEALQNGDSAAAAGVAATWTERRLKQGDLLAGTTGTNVLRRMYRRQAGSM